MRASTRATLGLATVSVVLGISSVAAASARQLHGGPMLGFAAHTGPSGVLGGTIALNGGYGLSDTWRLYTNLEYGLGASNTPTPQLRHHGALSFGIAYVLDVVSWLPWIGLGLNGVVVGSPTWVGFVPAAEVRGGVDFLTSRYFGLMLQVAYALPFANREQVDNVFTASFGVRFTADL